MNQTYMVFDFETRSNSNLKKIGAYDYAADPTTKVLCTGYKIGFRKELDNSKTKVAPFADFEFLDALTDPNVHLVAHNVFFELSIIKLSLARDSVLVRRAVEKGLFNISRWTCTAAMARRMGLPGKLEKAAQALGLPIQKDMFGHETMLRMSDGNNEINPWDWEALLKYCETDVDVESKLFTTLPLLDSYERTIWETDIRMNLRGILIDRTLVLKALQGIDRIKTWVDQEVSKLTGGFLKSARQRDAFLKYLENHGFDLSSLTRESVHSAITDPNTPNEIKRLLELRLVASKSSTSKYVQMEKRSRLDGRARDTMLYYGAHTGRQAAIGLQPHNLPKKSQNISKTDLIHGLGLLGNGDFEEIEKSYSNPNEFYSSAVKPMIIAEPGKILHMADFSQVEVRVLFWIARCNKGLQAFRQGRDLYVEMASAIYKQPVDDLLAQVAAEVPAAIFRRQLGKQTVLGAGFGIGVGGVKFQQTCKSYGIDISLALASESILTYRKVYPEVPKFWHKIEGAAIKAVLDWGSVIKCDRLTYIGVTDDYGHRYLKCTLPSGRSIFYFSPEIQYQRFGDRTNPLLIFKTFDSNKNQFVKESTWGGKLTENVVQGIARDITMEAITRCDKAGFDPLLAVHDAIITETDVLRADTPFDLICQNPDWCPDMPIAISFNSSERYG